MDEDTAVKVETDERNYYSLKGKASQMNNEGKILPQHRCFVLCSLMADCTDFKEDKSAMEVLLHDLSTKSRNNQKIEFLVSPKYHCELTGEGVEYVWAVMKKYYCRKPLEEENTKKKFKKVAREAAECVKQSSEKLFSARCCWYMIAYMNLSKGNRKLTYHD